MENRIKELIENALDKLGVNNFNDFIIEIPKDSKNGDFATNVAMKLAKVFKKNPRDIASDLVTNIEKDNFIDKIEIAGPGFINFFINKKYFESIIEQVLKDENYFVLDFGENKRVLVEFVSANPTGPLHIGHGRGAAYGDTLARLLRVAGFQVEKEYYINDAGNQMKMLGDSIVTRYKQLVNGKIEEMQDGYRGEYIIDIAKKIYEEYGDSLLDDPEKCFNICFKTGLDEIMKSIVDDLDDFRVSFDRWFSEKSLFEKGVVDKALSILDENGYLYEKDGAVWFKSTSFGDEKDRVVKKADGSYTYFASDIAYHLNKIERGYDLFVNVWGADHHGYMNRMFGALKALGAPDDILKIVLIQMVNLVKGGERISMSTRAGEFITLRWLIDEVGADAARFFYLMRDHNAQFDFDIDLAKSKSSDNPVYYVQYAHARVNSLFENAIEKGVEFRLAENLDKLTLDQEKEIIKKIDELKKVIKAAATHLEPHRISYYLQELASLFHNYYYNFKIISDDYELTNARLNLAKAVAKTIKFGLEILGVEAPEKM
ncbi:arginyl-tRNA synthetase [Deferribacter desulfuricans SSM1]|uniref:Arginine--tRNA ligase n=1 Tax=Deferribacter desulfuricans (strain DSM 14783 / JCM 11476 / NBRC 101012 / SSM1) TaxID=639282 RepID=D3PDZ7_DEFDS|nr:arginine--tRNA ligase [Deferribacter desulfuricans]BAI80820.1 arginyl-tRNA synthetase [Deferribacter desulfuricans SSM1]